MVLTCQLKHESVSVCSAMFKSIEEPGDKKSGTNKAQAWDKPRCIPRSGHRINSHPNWSQARTEKVNLRKDFAIEIGFATFSSPYNQLALGGLCRFEISRDLIQM